MNESQWQASLFEQRTAWAIALCAIVIIVIAASQPQWFQFTAEPETSQQVHQQPVSKTITRKSVSAPVAQAAQTKHATASPTKTPAKTKPVRTTSSKNKSNHQPNHLPNPKPATLSHAKHPTAALNASGIGKGFYVQIGAFKDKNRAQRLNNKLKKKGWSVHIISRKSSLHAIWIGPKSTRKKAEELLKTIQRKLNYKGFIVQNNT